MDRTPLFTEVVTRLPLKKSRFRDSILEKTRFVLKGLMGAWEVRNQPVQLF
jgi:hypothetical protein